MKLRVSIENGTPVRADVYIAGVCAELTRSGVQRLIETGNITADGRRIKKNTVLTGGESIEINIPPPLPVAAEARNIPLDIVFEDDDLIVINKPKGMVVHPAPGHSEDTAVNALLAHCQGSLSGIGGVLRPGIVHRLDKDTGGLLIAAKNDFTHMKLSEQLKNRSLTRIYDAIVIGGIAEAGTVNAPVGRHPVDRKRMAVTEKSSRHAVTHYYPVTQLKGHTHIKCSLETGRTHQIRVHMAYTGHPVLGDTIYGAKKCRFDTQGQCLHAAELRFIHPRSGLQQILYAPLPQYFIKLLELLREDY